MSARLESFVLSAQLQFGEHERSECLKGGNFVRAFVNSELWLPEVAPCIVWLELLAEFLDIGDKLAQSHTPPKYMKYGARNSHISQMVLEGQDGYQTVGLILLINNIYLYMGLR